MASPAHTTGVRHCRAVHHRNREAGSGTRGPGSASVSTLLEGQRPNDGVWLGEESSRPLRENRKQRRVSPVFTTSIYRVDDLRLWSWSSDGLVSAAGWGAVSEARWTGEGRGYGGFTAYERCRAWMICCDSALGGGPGDWGGCRRTGISEPATVVRQDNNYRLSNGGAGHSGKGNGGV